MQRGKIFLDPFGQKEKKAQCGLVFSSLGGPCGCAMITALKKKRDDLGRILRVSMAFLCD